VSLLAAALSRAHAFLLTPASSAHLAPRVAEGGRALDVAVVPLRPESGASTVAAGLARALVSAGASAARVAEVAPAELSSSRPDVTVLVVPEDVEPALASLVTWSVAERVGSIVVVVNRVRDRERWQDRAALCLPEARLVAAVTGSGWPAWGRLGRALTELAEIVLVAAARDRPP
jgi:hypothetical protein